MEIKIKLDDEALCGGCPFENGERRCNAGFVRDTARIVQRTQRVYFSPFYSPDESERMGFQPMRPRACLLATEPVTKAINGLPAQGAEGIMTATEIAHRRTKKVFVCTRCGNEHKNYQPCGPRR